MIGVKHDYTLWEYFFSLKSGHFTVWISDLCRKEPLNLQSKQAARFVNLSYSTEWWNGGTVDGRNGGISKDAEWMNILKRGKPFCMKQKSQKMELQ